MTLIQATPPISDAEYERLLEQPGFEFVGGRVVEKMMSFEAAEADARITAIILPAADACGSRVFSQSLSYKCYRDEPRKFRKPDVSVIRGERLAGVDPRKGFSPFPADLVIEVTSVNDNADDVNEKVEEYMQNGFPLVWLVFPRTRTVTIYRGDGTVSFLHEGDEITGESAVPALRCKVGSFFPPLAPALQP